MKLRINYGDDVITIPAAAAEHIARATKRDLRLLFVLLSDRECRSDYGQRADALAAESGVTRAELDIALSFWRGTGIIEADESEEIKKPAARVDPASAAATAAAITTLTTTTTATAAEPDAPTAAEAIAVKLRPTDELPRYSGEELAAVLERRDDAKRLIDAAQQTLGRVFNQSEIATLTGLLDYLNLSPEYILLLLSDCAAAGKTSLKYAEKTAFGLFDRDITTAEALEELFVRRRAAQSAEASLREIFGMGDRKLSAREKSYFETWICDWGFGEDIVRRAYDITVDNIGKVSMPYTNTVLAKWYESGYRTLDDVEAGLASYKKEKEKSGGSFDTDEFYNAALPYARRGK